MQHFNGLSYYVLPSLPTSYTVPDWLSIELGIFAGRLYINFPECAPLKEYLRLGDKTGGDAPPNNNAEHIDLFTTNPVSFLLDWLTLRRKGQDIVHTPMGYICQGRPLHKWHPFFVARGVDVEGVVAPEVGGGRIGGVRDGADVADDGDTDLEEEEEYDPMDHMG